MSALVRFVLLVAVLAFAGTALVLRSESVQDRLLDAAIVRRVAARERPCFTPSG